jgi:seryl-tRNA synthetase
MLNLSAMSGAVHISAFKDAIYKIEDEDLYLIATAEHPIVAYMKDKVLNGKDLPIRFVGISPCFRKEAGTHGKDTKGIFRIHQFEKVEQVVFCKKNQAKKEFDLLLKNLEDIFKALKIPYRLVILCSGDTGKKDSKTIDLEGWFPSQEKYRELGSCSTLGDYQARRSNIRYSESGGIIVADTLNNTVIATERAIACIVENYQQKDGSIEIPKVLRKYMNGQKKIGVR